MDIIKKYNDLYAERQEWTSTLEEVGRYVWPNARTIVKSEQTEDRGRVLTVDIADSTAIRAALKATSGTVSYLMPVGTRWYNFKPRKEDDLRDKNVLKRASKATEVTHSAILRSNFIREMFATIRSLFVFGTACISVEKIGGDLVYRNYHIADIFFEENSKGVIDTVFRQMFYTARQLIQEYGEEVIPDHIKMCVRKHPGKKFKVVHGVYPSDDYDAEKIDAKKFISEHVLVDDETFYALSCWPV
jgi:hypothetical protein